MLYLKWRWFRMDLARLLFRTCPSRYRLRLFDLLEAIRFLHVDHLEDVTNDFKEFYQ